MKVKINDIIQLAVAILLIIAATTTQSYNFYVFLRWTVFLLSAFVVYKVKDRIVAVILIAGIGILFNPILPFTFKKETWHIIDFVLGLLLIIIIDWKGYKNALSPKGKPIYKLVLTYLYSVLGIIGIYWFITTGIRVNPFHEYLLITQSKVANGFITDYNEYQDMVFIPDSQGGGTEDVTDSEYKYEFTTENGKKIAEWSEDVIINQDFTGNPIPIKVEYLPNNPEINRVKDGTNQCKTLKEFIWERLVLDLTIFLFLVALIVSESFKATRKYLNESKILLAQNESSTNAQ